MKQIKQVEHLSQMKSMCLNIYMYMYMYSKKNKVYPKNSTDVTQLLWMPARADDSRTCYRF